MSVRVCGLPEQLSLDIEVRRSGRATWYVTEGLPGLDRDTLRRVAQTGFDRWSAVAGCAAQEAPDEGTADLVIVPAALDGPLGVLADCQLPGPRVQRLRLDSGERWLVHPGSGNLGGQIDLLRVLTHEVGHFWGVGHIGTGNLMAPTYSDVIEGPQAGDVAEIRSRYGPPIPLPGSGGGNPSEPAELWVIARSGAVTAKFRLERIG